MNLFRLNFLQVINTALALAAFSFQSVDASFTLLSPNQQSPICTYSSISRTPKEICRTSSRIPKSSLFEKKKQNVRLQASVSDLGMVVTNRAVPPVLNAVLVTSSITILVGYHLNLFKKEFKSENSNSTTKTWRQYQADTREEWSRHVRDTDGWLYAIQSLRNAITAQTFLATTVLSLLTLITGRVWDILRATTVQDERRLLTIQLVSIAMTMLFSAYQFLQGVRLMTHAGFMFPVKKNSTKVDNIMRQTQNCQWMGLRWMYISLAPITWTVGGSRAFFVASLLLLQFFRTIDKEPEGLGYEEFQGGYI